MRKVSLSLLLVILSAVTVLSQEVTVEKGKPGELKGVTKVYLAVPDSALRQSIQTEISRALPNLIFTATGDKADVWLIFSSQTSGGAPHLAIMDYRTSSVAEPIRTSVLGSIVKPIAAHRVRTLMVYQDTAESANASHLGTSFARKFVKLYRQANQ